MISKGALIVSISNRSSHVCNVGKITCSVRHYASKKKGGFFRKMVDSGMETITGKSKKNEEMLSSQMLSGQHLLIQKKILVMKKENLSNGSLLINSEI